MWSQRDHKILIGAEGITAEGSYTWDNRRLSIDCALDALDEN